MCKWRITLSQENDKKAKYSVGKTYSAQFTLISDRDSTDVKLKYYTVLQNCFGLSKYQNVICIANREEKSLRPVAMEQKFLDDNKPKTSLRKSISHCFKLHRSYYSISFNLSNYLGLNPEGPL